MMQSSYDDNEDDFAVNPFRSANAVGETTTNHANNNPDDPFYTHHPTPPSQQSQQQPPIWSQAISHAPGPPQWSPQQQQAQQAQPQLDPNSGMMGSFLPQSQATPLQAPARSTVTSQLSGTMDQRLGEGMNTAGGGMGGFWNRCTACFRLEGYQPYFDLDTIDIIQRIQASMTLFWQPDGFRTTFLQDNNNSNGIPKPDLYGPLWIPLTLIFVLALYTNGSLHSQYYHAAESASSASKSSTSGNSTVPIYDPSKSTSTLPAFESDLHPLVRAMSVVTTFAWMFPSFLWLASTCILGSNAPATISWAMWMCVYGYCLTIYIPVVLLLWILPQWILLKWILLILVTIASCLLVLRNLSSPLLSQDPAKASPIIMSMLGAHIVWFLVLQFGF